MLELYPEIHAAHIGFIWASGALMTMRGAMMLAGFSWPRHFAMRILAMTIDTCIITAAVMLLTILPGEMFENHWLTVKLGFLAIYFGAGYMALRSSASPVNRACLLLLSLGSYAMAYGIARMHDPLGWLA